MDNDVIYFIYSLYFLYLSTGIIVALMALKEPLQRPTHIIVRCFAIAIAVFLWLPLHIAIKIYLEDDK